MIKWLTPSRKANAILVLSRRGLTWGDIEKMKVDNSYFKTHSYSVHDESVRPILIYVMAILNFLLGIPLLIGITNGLLSVFREQDFSIYLLFVLPFAYLAPRLILDAIKLLYFLMTGNMRE